ncbi:hypothetical protein MTO96_013195 [Rhipicephalus appendiculatus]
MSLLCRRKGQTALNGPAVENAFHAPILANANCHVSARFAASESKKIRVTCTRSVGFPVGADGGVLRLRRPPLGVARNRAVICRSCLRDALIAS